MSARKRVNLILLTTLIALGGGIFLWNLPRLRVAWGWAHRPTARLQVASHPGWVLFKTEESSSPNAAAGYRRFINTQIAFFNSREVVNSALQKPGISQLEAIKGRYNPIGWLRDHLELTMLEDSEVLEVALAAGSGASDEDQAKLVNAIVRAYLDEVVTRDRMSRNNRLEMLRKLANSYHDRVKTRREMLRSLAARAGSDDKSTLILKEQYPKQRIQDLVPIQTRLRLEEVGMHAVLERRKKSEGAATDQGRKEMATIEDKLVALAAQQEFVKEVLANLEVSTVATDNNLTLDSSDQRDELKQIEEFSRKIDSELEKLNVELQAPSRITLIEEAEPGPAEKGGLPLISGIGRQ